MKPFTRRDFLLSAGGIVALSSFRNSFPAKVKPLRLSFSTLGCPDWSLNQITDFAVANNYQGIEIRGVQRILDPEKSPHFDTPAHIAETKELFRKKNLKIVDLGSSAEMHHKDPATRNKNLDEARRFIDLAQELGCPYIRVFPNHIPPGQDRAETLVLIAEGLKTLGDYCKGKNVTVLMETHGDLVKSDEIVQVMESVSSDQVGLVWDILNMWTIIPEDPASVYPKLKKYIRHTHLKDVKIDRNSGKKEGDNLIYKLMGEGESPIFEAVDLLLKDGYSGFFSFEWEKLWHPEIAASEIAIAQYSKAMTDHYKQLK